MTATTVRPSEVAQVDCLQDARKLFSQLDLPWLTAKQEAIAVEILNGVDDGKLHATLRGPAGTGKTTLLTAIILQAVSDGLNVVVTSFTHKACSVLRDKLDAIQEELPHLDLPQPCTLHKLLNLKPNNAKYGEKETFYQSRCPSFADVDFVIVDECSMIGEDLMTYINSSFTDCSIPILFAGDPYQLRPVGEDKRSQSFFASQVFKLSQVLRHDGAILNLATKIRKLDYVPVVTAAEGGGSRIVTYPTNAAMEVAWLDAVVNAPGEANDLIMLTYTNDNRRRLNAIARTAIHGPDSPRFLAGDVVLTLSPYMRDGQVVYNNNQDLQIGAKPEFVPALRPLACDDEEFACWKLELTDGNVIYALKDAEEEKRFQKHVGALGKKIAADQRKARASSNHKVLQQCKTQWATHFFPLKGFFADIDFRYALTIHKSQGSTFKRVFVNNDYLRARGEKKALLYVAVTRASTEVHHVKG